ncbi:hypothetical protein [Mycoplasma mycoides]|uniref:hypothetical protein n=1 Tax=Mycoplasma mycoides TaxID=2102 RepID=UPI00057E19A7|nr:hypothetical protein [Mycoplasma mycoides]
MVIFFYIIHMSSPDPLLRTLFYFLKKEKQVFSQINFTLFTCVALEFAIQQSMIINHTFFINNLLMFF